MIKTLSRKDVQAFILANENADPFELSLKHKSIAGVPAKEVANQIAVRKKAKTKLPEWYGTSGIIWPPMLSMEQCSSELTAQYKSNIISGKNLLDLTGGAGVDTFYLSKVFDGVTYVERDNYLCELAQHNFGNLHADNILTIKSTAEKFINTYDSSASAVFIDPGRRGAAKKKVFLWSDCTPDILKLQDKLLSKSEVVMIKASPMLDITAAIQQLQNVVQVHVVSVKNECKEVLYLCQPHPSADPVTVKAINFSTDTTEYFSFTYEDEKTCTPSYAAPSNYLYVPNTSIMKAGAFKSIARAYNLQKLHPNTHLYTSDKLLANFPGRIFHINAITPYNKKALLKNLPAKTANIAVRNFPYNVETIRKKTAVKSGGEMYVFGVTDIEENIVLLVTEKVC